MIAFTLVVGVWNVEGKERISASLQGQDFAFLTAKPTNHTGKGAKSNSIISPFTALVQRQTPDLEKRYRPHLNACNDSWRVDETFIEIKNTWMYLYEAIDSEGNTLSVLFSTARDAQAAGHFFP